VIGALRWAVAFLTMLPVAPRREPRAGELARSAAFFPLVGALVGAAGWGVDWVSMDHVPDLVRGLLVVTALALLTRALHLDGLADTVDGLGSMRKRERMLQIMRDPHIGAFGAVMLMVVILLQAASIAEIAAPVRLGAVLAATVASRLTMTLAGWLLPYARPSGTGSPFIGQVRWWAAAVALLLGGACAWAGGGTSALWGLGVGVGVGLIVALLTALKLKGATGDTLGASGELAQTAVLIWAAAGMMH
jgi:adenosylcobinamide-GDP ribazoletransferase